MKKIDLSDVKNGIVCFTFDDRNFEGWINTIPLFEKYNAHASFFISGEFNENALNAAKTLYDVGHTIGIHTKNHADATTYFEENGAEAYYKNEICEQLSCLVKHNIDVTAFAYPNNRRNEITDRYLLQFFRRFRAGVKDTEEYEKFVPVHKLSCNFVMHGFGIGEYYNTIESELIDKIKKAAKNNCCITFFSHDISQDATHINMKTSLLEKCLKAASESGMIIAGFNELP